MTTDNQIRISRRTVLAGLGTIGVTAVGAGLGTTAYFSDEESFDGNTLVAGSLDLKVDWTEHYYDGSAGMQYLRRVDGPGEITENEHFLEMEGDEPILYAVTDLDAFMAATSIESFPDEDDDGIQDVKPDGVSECVFYGDMDEALSSDRRTEGLVGNHETVLGDPLIYLDDVKPGDWGEVTFSLHLCDNPGYIWLQGDLLENAENGFSEPEMKDPDEDGTEVGELADEIMVTIWYDDGDNVLEEGEEVIVTGSLSKIMSILNTAQGIPLSAGGGFQGVVPIGDEVNDFAGTCEVVPGNPTCSELLRSLKLEDYDLLAIYNNETLPYDITTPGGTLTIEAMTVESNGDDEVMSLEVSTDFPVQTVITKGGPRATVCRDDDGGLLNNYHLEAPVNNSGGPAAVSHISLCYDGEPNGGGPGPSGEPRECFVNSTDAYLGFKWWLPVDHANEIQTDTVAFNVGFYTEQCRHNDGAGPQVATIDMPPSQLRTDETVFVNSVFLPDGGYVVLHDPNDGGAVIGHSAYYAPGTWVNLEVVLDSLPQGDTVIAMAHKDTDGDQTYDFGTSGGADDGPYVDAGGAVTDSGEVYFDLN